MNGFWRYIAGTVVRPVRTFRSLRDDPKRHTKGFRAVVLIGILYACTAAGLAAAGALNVAPALIPLSPDNYYFWEIFFALPVVLLGWIAAAVLAQILSRGKGSRGTFKSLLGTLGFALAVPQFLTWIAESAFAVLLLLGMRQAEFMELVDQPGTLQTLFIGYHAVAAAWMLGLVIAAVGISRRLRWWLAGLIGVLTTAFFAAVIVIFVR